MKWFKIFAVVSILCVSANFAEARCGGKARGCRGHKARCHKAYKHSCGTRAACSSCNAACSSCNATSCGVSGCSNGGCGTVATPVPTIP